MSGSGSRKQNGHFKQNELTILRLAAALLVLGQARAVEQMPSGTLLPIMLSSSLNATTAKPGKQVKARLMQSVQLPDGRCIPEGASVRGQILEGRPGYFSGSRIVVSFDAVVFHRRVEHFTSSLRALASAMDVFSAQLPTSDFADRGTTTSDWVTEQVGGDEVFRGNGSVLSPYGELVGRATDSGDVFAKPLPVPGKGCRGTVATSRSEQSFWIFSTSACGVYGLGDIKIAHAGRTEPIGKIVMESSKVLKIPGGSGWLIRVD